MTAALILVVCLITQNTGLPIIRKSDKIYIISLHRHNNSYMCYPLFAAPIIICYSLFLHVTLILTLLFNNIHNFYLFYLHIFVISRVSKSRSLFASNFSGGIILCFIVCLPTVIRASINLTVHRSVCNNYFYLRDPLVMHGY